MGIVKDRFVRPVHLTIEFPSKIVTGFDRRRNPIGQLAGDNRGLQTPLETFESFLQRFFSLHIHRM